MATGVTAVVRLENLEVRNAMSPSDFAFFIIKDVTLSSSAADVDLLQYLPQGSKILSYIYMKQATTTFTSGTSNILATAAAVAGASAVVDVLVLCSAQKLNG